MSTSSEAGLREANHSLVEGGSDMETWMIDAERADKKIETETEQEISARISEHATICTWRENSVAQCGISTMCGRMKMLMVEFNKRQLAALAKEARDA